MAGEFDDIGTEVPGVKDTGVDDEGIMDVGVEDEGVNNTAPLSAIEREGVGPVVGVADASVVDVAVADGRVEDKGVADAGVRVADVDDVGMGIGVVVFISVPDAGGTDAGFSVATVSLRAAGSSREVISS